MKFMIVDDNPAVRRLLRRLIALPDDEVTECGDGDEACAAYATTQPDWVLMDVQMPRVNGLDATRRILTTAPTARIVIVTNHDAPELRTAAYDAGACGFVLKENLDEVCQLLQSLPPTTNADI
jgi:DNA-binding NarL/FixJ family response regulator